MAELVALWIVCKNIGEIARSRGVRALPYQQQAVMLWFGFELGIGFVAATLGLPSLVIYLAALAGALLSLKFSFGAVRRAKPRHPIAQPAVAAETVVVTAAE